MKELIMRDLIERDLVRVDIIIKIMMIACIVLLFYLLIAWTVINVLDKVKLFIPKWLDNFDLIMTKIMLFFFRFSAFIFPCIWLKSFVLGIPGGFITLILVEWLT